MLGLGGDVGPVPAPVELALLRSFQLSTDAGEVDLPLTAQRVVAFLALHEQPVRRSYVAGVLWPDSSEERASASLRSALWRLRRPLCELVSGTATTLRLAAAVSVDVVASSHLAQELQTGPPGLDPASTDAWKLISHFGHDLLPDWYDDWLTLWRERWHQTRLHALDAMATRLIDAGHLSAAIEAGLAAVRAEPLRESGHYVLIRAHVAEGNLSEALRQYHSFRALLRRELGIEPSPRIRALTSAFTPG